MKDLVSSMDKYFETGTQSAVQLTEMAQNGIIHVNVSDINKIFVVGNQKTNIQIAIALH
jgi:hypothetical protein